MPRYYFHLTDGKQVLSNHKGIDRPACRRSRRRARAGTRPQTWRGHAGWNWRGWFVVIVDEHGHKVDEMPIADA